MWKQELVTTHIYGWLFYLKKSGSSWQRHLNGQPGATLYAINGRCVDSGIWFLGNNLVWIILSSLSRHLIDWVGFTVNRMEWCNWFEHASQLLFNTRKGIAPSFFISLFLSHSLSLCIFLPLWLTSPCCVRWCDHVQRLQSQVSAGERRFPRAWKPAKLLPPCSILRLSWSQTTVARRRRSRLAVRSEAITPCVMCSGYVWRVKGKFVRVARVEKKDR